MKSFRQFINDTELEESMMPFSVELLRSSIDDEIKNNSKLIKDAIDNIVNLRDKDVDPRILVWALSYPEYLADLFTLVYIKTTLKNAKTQADVKRIAQKTEKAMKGTKGIRSEIGEHILEVTKYEYLKCTR